MAYKFKPIRNDAGQVVGHEPWKTYEEESRERSQQAQQQSRMRAPAWSRKKMAVDFATGILGEGSPQLRGLGFQESQLEIFASGSNKITCRQCGTEHNYQAMVCSNCSIKLFQPMARHSSIEWLGSYWKVNLARNVTQGKTLKSLNRAMKTLTPPFDLEKTSAQWLTFGNVCFVVAPIAYTVIECHTRGIPYQVAKKFGPAQFRAQQEKTHFKVTRSLARRYSGLIYPYI